MGELLTSALGEIEESVLAALAGSASEVVVADALTSFHITLVASRSGRVAIAS